MAGYLLEEPGGESPERISSGVHDRLFARALAFMPGGEVVTPGVNSAPYNTVVLLQLDLLNLDRLCMEKIRAGIKAFGLSKDNLLVTCIHTHSGFGGIFDTSDGLTRAMLPLYGTPDERLVEFLTEKSLEVIGAALKNGVETTLRMGKGRIKGLASNRHNKDLPCDDSIFTIEFLRADGKKILLYNLSAHPTVLNGKNTLLSADFPGAVVQKLERRDRENEERGYEMVVFINGSAGDMSSRFTRKKSSFSECERFGSIVTEAIADVIKTSTAEAPLKTVSFSYQKINLKAARVPDLETAERNLAGAKQNLEKAGVASSIEGSLAARQNIRKAESFVEGAAINLLKARYLKSDTKTIPVEVGFLRINGKFIICSPFELFSTLALKLKSRKDVEMFGYVNALQGYLAGSDSYDEMDYEALSSLFVRGEGERYIEEIEKLYWGSLLKLSPGGR
jgi:hypothetical protein